MAPRIQRLWIPVAVALGLAGLTWLWTGYHWLAWPQPGFVDHVLRYDGELVGDWHTSLPPVHWAMAHAYGWLPFGALEPVAAISWIAYLAILWAAFLVIAQRLGAGRWAAVAAVPLALVTGFAGVGVSGTILAEFYPPAFSFAFVLAAVAAVLSGRPVAAAGLLGVATLVHSNQGVLGTAAVGLAVADRLGRDRRAWALAAVAYAVPALPSVIEAAVDQSGGSALTAAQRYDLFAVVRQPHHLLWHAFTAAEYAQTIAWCVVLAAGIALATPAVRRSMVIIVASVGVLLAVGAIAGEAERPVLLVLLQTSRLSALLIALGVAAGAAWLTRLLGRGAVAALLAIFVGAVYLARWWPDIAVHTLAGQASWVTPGGAGAGLLIVVALVATLAKRRRLDLPTQATRVATAAAVLGAAALILGDRHNRVGPLSASDRAYADVADHARELTPKGTEFITPPDRDGWRDLARRATVVEFGTVRYGKGDGEWIRRIDKLAGTPAITQVQPYDTDVSERVAALGADYDRTIATDNQVPCDLGVRWVVTRVGRPVPRWLEQVYANRYFRLNRLRPGACV